tara:strand:- start:10047 stop:10280 length:234 start_codon:yes stop_codon:yes gene_type:complete
MKTLLKTLCFSLMLVSAFAITFVFNTGGPYPQGATLFPEKVEHAEPVVRAPLPGGEEAKTPERRFAIRMQVVNHIAF